MTNNEIVLNKIRNTLKSVLLVGCSAAEVNTLMKAQKVNCLPELYKDILYLCGKRGLNRIFDGDAIYLDLIDLKEHLASTELILPNDIFVFFCHHGYLFYFFRTNTCTGSIDVFVYDEVDLSRFCHNFEEFVLLSLDNSKVNWVTVMYDPASDEFHEIDEP